MEIIVLNIHANGSKLLSVHYYSYERWWDVLAFSCANCLKTLFPPMKIIKRLTIRTPPASE